MRRTVATLLVVASPLLVAVPVGAADGPAPGRAVPPAVAPAPALPAAGLAVAPVAVAPPAVAAPAAPALPGGAATGQAAALAAAPVRPAARQASLRARDIDDAAYAARLQAELCAARTIFCGLDRHGRYPAH